MSDRFEGWYYKQQAAGRTLALIPGAAADSAFVQVITDGASHIARYPPDAYRRGGRDGQVRVGDSVFSPEGVRLAIHTETFSLSGTLRYGPLTPLKSDIMGPFRRLPMETRHAVLSMRHAVGGAVSLNGETFDFSGGVGYIEGDSGRSFPEAYGWVQANDLSGDASVMIAAARVRALCLPFTGVICAVWLDGREYRLATYLGARLARFEPGAVTVAQGGYRLSAEWDAGEGLPLSAPDAGRMSRQIIECPSAKVRFLFTKGDRTLLDAVSHGTSFEMDGELRGGKGTAR